jgi:spermidine synthase
VGYILMDRLSIQALSVCMLIASIAVAAYLLRQGAAYRRPFAIAGVAVAAALAAASPRVYENLYARLLAMQAGIRVDSFRHVVETRSGVITVSAGGAIFGGGVYDGRFNIDPVNDTNGIYRVYALSAIARPAAEVLVVGLASGSWAQVLANRPDVAHVTIVEINPGYLRLIPQYPQVASLLTNPKVTVVVDDGRRWLIRHPDRKFDLSVMNVSVHGRVHSTHVLSVEFLDLVRRHLNPGGIHFFNTTWSPESMLSGVTTFKYGLRIFNFLAVSDSPIVPDKRLLEERLRAFTIDGRPVFDERLPAHRQALEKIVAMVDSADTTDGSDRLNESWETGERLRQRLQRLAGVGIITDDNMGSEWR